MIKINVFRKNEAISAFEISGHANSGPYGYDLVCAGVSAVSFGAVNAVYEICQIDLTVDQAGEGGYLYVEIPTSIPEENMQKAQLIFEAMLISMRTIERYYSEFINIQDREVHE